LHKSRAQNIIIIINSSGGGNNNNNYYYYDWRSPLLTVPPLANNKFVLLAGSPSPAQQQLSGRRVGRPAGQTAGWLILFSVADARQRR
jgi:hypothetical protein